MSIKNITEVELKKSEFDLIPGDFDFSKEENEISELVVKGVVIPEVEAFMEKAKAAGFYGVGQKHMAPYMRQLKTELNTLDVGVETAQFRLGVLDFILNAVNAEVPGSWQFVVAPVSSYLNSLIENTHADRVSVNPEGTTYYSRFTLKFPIRGKKIEFDGEVTARFNTSLVKGKGPGLEDISKQLKEIKVICKYLRILNVKAIQNRIPLYLEGAVEKILYSPTKPGILNQDVNGRFIITATLIYPIFFNGSLYKQKIEDIENALWVRSKNEFSGSLDVVDITPHTAFPIKYKTLETYTPFSNSEELEDLTWSPLIPLLFLEDFKTILTTIFRRMSTNETRLFD